MRKVILTLGVLAALLVVCTPASAITIFLRDYDTTATETTVMVGTIVQIKCNISGALAGEFSGFDAWIRVEGPGVAVGQGEVGSWVRRTGVTFFGSYEETVFHDNGTPDVYEDDWEEILNHAPADKQGGILWSPVSLTGGGTIATFSILATGPGDITVSIIPFDPGTWDGTYVANSQGAVAPGLEYGSTYVIHSIPEPMTLSLLGVGLIGLLRIRRRK